MKTVLVSHSDSGGGAFVASYRLLIALRSGKLDVEMLVARKNTDHYFIRQPQSLFSRVTIYVATRLDKLFQHILDPSSQRSGNWFPGPVKSLIEDSRADVINLHWINRETVSIGQIRKFSIPVVLTIHDMWAISGCAHYIEGNEEKDDLDKRSILSKIVDRYFLYLKRRSWKSLGAVVAPSQWLTDHARSSCLFEGRPLITIPNPIDTSVFRPMDNKACRESFGFLGSACVLGFGAVGGGVDYRKGFDLLLESLQLLWEMGVRDIEVAIFGQSEPQIKLDLPFPVNYVGVLIGDVSLSVFYNAIDVMLVPSRQEAFGQTASEAQSCGKPVVAFNATGLVDVVAHKETGYLAKPYDTHDLAEGVLWVRNEERRSLLGKNARERANKLWSYDVVANQYMDVYKAVVRS